MLCNLCPVKFNIVSITGGSESREKSFTSSISTIYPKRTFYLIFGYKIIFGEIAVQFRITPYMRQKHCQVIHVMGRIGDSFDVNVSESLIANNHLSVKHKIR